jgi:hypothetical protein
LFANRNTINAHDMDTDMYDVDLFDVEEGYALGNFDCARSNLGPGLGCNLPEGRI